MDDELLLVLCPPTTPWNRYHDATNSSSSNHG
jgi:hypothetical protein